MSSTVQKEAQRAMMLELYMKKWNEMPDMPSDAPAGKTLDTNVYFREWMEVSPVPCAADTSRTPSMDAYFKKLIFLSQLPDGTKTYSPSQFMSWTAARPKFSAACGKFLPTVMPEMVEYLEERPDFAQTVGFDPSDEGFLEMFKQRVEKVRLGLFQKSGESDGESIKRVLDEVEAFKNHLAQREQEEAIHGSSSNSNAKQMLDKIEALANRYQVVEREQEVKSKVQEGDEAIHGSSSSSTDTSNATKAT